MAFTEEEKIKAREAVKQATITQKQLPPQEDPSTSWDAFDKLAMQREAKQKLITNAKQQVQQKKTSSAMDKVKDFGIGVGQGVLSTVRGMSSLGEKIIDTTLKTALPKAAEDRLGLNGKKQTNAEALIPEAAITPDSKAQAAGKFLEQVAEFFVPGGVGVKVAKVSEGTKLAKLANLGARALTEGATGAAVTAVQTGGDTKETLKSGAIGAAIPIGAKIMSLPFKAVVEKLPQSLVRLAVGQGKKELLAGKDVSNFVLENKRIGTAESLIGRSGSEIESLNTQIGSNLKSINVTKNKITNKSIFDQVAQGLNEEGGNITSGEVRDIVTQLAPQSKGLLSKPSMGLINGNKLRQSVDKTLGDKAFLGGQLPFNKDVLKKFNSVLREEVKSKAPEGTRGLFDNLSKEITLRDALLNKYTNSKSPITLVDVIAALVGSVGGVPGALATYAAKKAVQSPLALTGAASILKSSEKLAPILNKLAPAERALILEAIQNKTN